MHLCAHTYTHTHKGGSANFYNFPNPTIRHFMEVWPGEQRWKCGLLSLKLCFFTLCTTTSNSKQVQHYEWFWQRVIGKCYLHYCLTLCMFTPKTAINGIVEWSGWCCRLWTSLFWVWHHSDKWSYSWPTRISWVRWFVTFFYSTF